MSTIGVEKAVGNEPAKSTNGRGFRVVGINLGILLLTAAGLKVWGISVDAVARVGIFYSPSFQSLVILIEFLMGLWLLSGWLPIGSWQFSLLTFAVFAAFSFYSGFIGVATCGCFGAIAVSPWWAFGIDVVVIVSLMRFHPIFRTRESLIASIKTSLIGIGTVSVILIGLLALGQFSFGSVAAALAWLRNENVTISPDLVDVGAGAAGELVATELEVTNWGQETVYVVGGTADCSCVAILDLPMDIEANTTKFLTIQVRLPRAGGLFNRPAMLIIKDDKGYKRVFFALTGNVRQAAGRD